MKLHTVNAIPAGVLVVAILGAGHGPGCSSAFAQADGPAEATASANPQPLPTLRTYLESLHYDAAERGALLAVSPDKPLPADPDAPEIAPVGEISLGALARRASRKPVTVGSMTVLAPAMMTVIEDHLGKANPFLGMRSSDTLTLLMGSFTPAQWQAVCGVNGIGLGDLDDAQKQLFDVMLPTNLEISKIDVTAGTEPGSKRYSKAELFPIADRIGIRLRLNRQVGYEVLGGASERSPGLGGGIFSDEPGMSLLEIASHNQYGTGDNTFNKATSAFGVPLIRTVTNRQKPSQIDYASPRLNVAVFLDNLDAKCTLGDLIARADRATGLTIIPDRRVAGLTVYVRGTSVRAGDLLQALALAVTGTYRKVGDAATAPAYVLTNDIEGSGTRLTRIEAWAELAQAQRRKLLGEAAQRAARQNPLSYLKFAPDDPLALSEGEMQMLDDSYRKKPSFFYTYPGETTSSDLPPGLKAAVGRTIEEEANKGHTLDAGKVRLQMNLKVSFLVPDFGPVGGFGMTYFPSNLSGIAYVRPEVPSAAPQPASHVHAPNAAWLTAPNSRRIFLCAPANAGDAERFIDEAVRLGFTEVWIQADATIAPDAVRSLLVSAVASGKRKKIAVTADLSLLRNAGLNSEPERTIAGRTPDEFTDAYMKLSASTPPAESPADRKITTRQIGELYGGWQSVAADEPARRANELAQISGLAGIVFQATAPPGFIPHVDPLAPDVISTLLLGGDFGYTDARREAFLRHAGIDPIDVRCGMPALIGVPLRLPFFPDESRQDDIVVKRQPGEGVGIKSPQRLWDDYRQAENKDMMRRIYQIIRANRPTLPIWIDDRVSDYENVYEDWFGTMDTPDRLPNSTELPGYTFSGYSAAHATSKICLLHATYPTSPVTKASISFADFFSIIGSRAAAEKWNGVVFDFSQMNGDDALRLLQTIPETKRSGGNAGKG